MSKILVTGGLGFIGSNLIEKLLKRNYKVLNIDKVSYASNFYNTRDFSNKKNYKFIRLDINNRSKLRKVFKLHNNNDQDNQNQTQDEQEKRQEEENQSRWVANKHFQKTYQVRFFY